MYVSPDFNSGKFSSSCEMMITLKEHLKARALEAEAKAWTLKAKATIFFLEDPRGQGLSSRTTSLAVIAVYVKSLAMQFKYLSCFNQNKYENVVELCHVVW
jgi:hypothetical protein